MTSHTATDVAADEATIRVYVGPSPSLLAPRFEGPMGHRDLPVGPRSVAWSYWVSEEGGTWTLNHEAIVDGLIATEAARSPGGAPGLKVHVLLRSCLTETSREVIQAISTLRAAP